MCRRLVDDYTQNGHFIKVKLSKKFYFDGKADRLSVIIQETMAHVMSSFDPWHARSRVINVYMCEGFTFGDGR